MIDDLYREELRWLHESGRTFAARHPEAARWLGEAGADPDVERLLEGVAFLAARLRARQEAVDDEVAQGLAAAVLPTALRPLPALAIVRFAPRRDLQRTERVAAGTALDSVAIDGEACRFRLAWDIEVPPARIEAIELHAGERPRLELALALGDGAVPAQLGPVLRLFAQAEAPLARALVQALAGARSVQAVDAEGRLTPLVARWLGPGVAAPVLPDDTGCGRAHALLAEGLAWPELSRFVELSGPPGWGLPASARGVRVVAELARLPSELRGVGPDDLLIGCGPALNLWEAEAEPLLIDGTRREAAVAVAGRPGAAAWAVRRVRGHAAGRPGRDWRHARAVAGDGPCWQELPRDDGLALALGRPDAEAGDEVLSIDVLAHDGVRVARLGAGDLCVPTIAVPGSLAFRNLLPPTRALPPPGGVRRLHDVAARLRLAATGLTNADDLRALLALHDRRAAAENGGRTTTTAVAAAIESLRLDHAAVPWGAAAARALTATVRLDEERLGGEAAAWMLGNLLDHAWAALAPLGTVTALVVELARAGRTLRWPPRCAGAQA